MVNRTLFSVALLIAAGTVALLGSSANAEEPTPIALTNEMQDKISGSLWEGDWYDTGNGVGGPAGLYLIIGYGRADAGLRIYEAASGDHTYRATGKVKGNTMELVSRSKNTVSLSLYKEKGKLVLKGEYEVMSGEYSGNTGTYYFVKRAE